MSYRSKETEKVNNNFKNQHILMYIRYYTTFNLLFLSECINDVLDLGLTNHKLSYSISSTKMNIRKIWAGNYV